MGTGRDFEEMWERGVMGLCMILSEIDRAKSNRHNLRPYLIKTASL